MSICSNASLPAITSSYEYKIEKARTYRTLEVAVRKSLPGSSPPSSGHGTYIDLRAQSEGLDRGRHSNGDAESNAPEEPADMPRP